METQTNKEKFNIKTHLDLIDKTGEVDIGKLIDFMDVSKAELAKAFNLTSNQLKPDRLSSVTKDTIADLARSIEYVANIFKGDVKKTRKWFNLSNIHFGGHTPKKMILIGRFHKVSHFIYNSSKR